MEKEEVLNESYFLCSFHGCMPLCKTCDRNPDLYGIGKEEVKTWLNGNKWMARNRCGSYKGIDLKACNDIERRDLFSFEMDGLPWLEENVVSIFEDKKLNEVNVIVMLNSENETNDLIKASGVVRFTITRFTRYGMQESSKTGTGEMNVVENTLSYETRGNDEFLLTIKNIKYEHNEDN